MYDFRMVQKLDESTCSVKLPFGTYNRDEDADVGVWVLLELEVVPNEHETVVPAASRTSRSGRVIIPNVRHTDIDSWVFMPAAEYVQ